MAQRAIDARQHGSGVSSPIDADRLLAVLGHRRQDQLQLLQRVAGGDLAAAQLRPARTARAPARRAAARSGRRPSRSSRRRAAPPPVVLQLGVVVKPPLGQVDGDHLPRPERALLADRGLVHRHHARPRTPRSAARRRSRHSASGAARCGPARRRPSGHRSSRAPPGRPTAPSPRCNRRTCPAQAFGISPSSSTRPRASASSWPSARPPAAHQHLEHRVQRAGVRRARRDDRLDVVGRIAERAARPCGSRGSSSS